MTLAIMYLQAGRPDLAERYMSEGIPLRNGEPDLTAPRMGDNLILLGVTREMLGRPADAVWAHEWGVRAFRATRGDDDAGTVRARANLARTYAGLGRGDEAEPLLQEVIPIFEAQDNEGELSVALNALGLVRQGQNRHVEAIALFERALAVFEKLKGPDYQECATVLRNLARSAAARGDDIASRRALTRAERILQRRGYSRH
jgi:tetratricopeptide (TPR) repeat protein